MNASLPGAEPATRLGFAAEQIVQELGWDDDIDAALRDDVVAVCGSELEDEDYTGETDAVLLWWRSDDGDLTDTIVDALGQLVDGGFIVVCTPRAGGPGAVEAVEIDEAARTAGMHTTGRLSVGSGWTVTRVVARRSAVR